MISRSSDLEEAETLIGKIHRRVSEPNAGNAGSVSDALQDDLNTTEAFSKLNQLSGTPLSDALELLGIEFSEINLEISADEIERQIDERLAYFAAKNFTEADKIRDELAAQGIQLKDSKDSQTGERITTWEVKR